jgi:hypothetical protein
MKWIVLFSIICNIYVVFHHDVVQSFLYNKNDDNSSKIITVTNIITEKKLEVKDDLKPFKSGIKPKLHQKPKQVTPKEVKHFLSTNKNSNADLLSEIVRIEDNTEPEYNIKVKVRTIDSFDMTNMEVIDLTSSIENNKLNREATSLTKVSEGTTQTVDASVSIGSTDESDNGELKKITELAISTPTIGVSEIIHSENTSVSAASIGEQDKGVLKKYAELVTPTSSISETTQVSGSSISDKTVNDVEHQVAVKTNLENKVISDAESQIKELSEANADEDDKKIKQYEKSLTINRNFEMALQYNMNGNHTKAIPLYLNILEVDPNHKEANYNLALTKIELNDLKEGCKLLQKSYNLGINQAKEMIDQHCRW